MRRRTSYTNDIQGILYLVATPIGNLSEFSSRAIETLQSVDVIACEDTRTSSVLLNHFEIHKKLIAYHNFNEEESAKGILEMLKEGKKVALISDAGYPLLSDPGFQLVRLVRENELPVTTISGPNAGINALVASGMDTRHFLFYGFLNAKTTAAKKELEALKDFPYTMIFYEAPHRIEKSLENMLEVLGDRHVVLARELTKLHEEYIEGTLSELKELHDLKGEMVVLVEGKDLEEESVDVTVLLQEVKEMVDNGVRAKEAVTAVSKKHGYSKNELYDLYHHQN